ISVIVPVRNEAGHIQCTLTQLLSQDYDSQRYEVIVVDGQSTDGTWDIVAALQEKHGNLRLLRNAKRWSSAARNAAIRSAQGDILAVIDGHCEIEDRSYLIQLAHAFARIGLFDERFDACEDVELNHRVAQAGMTCFFTPRLQGRYVPRGSLRGLFQQMVRYGRGRYRLLRKHPDTFSIACLLPAIFLS